MSMYIYQSKLEVPEGIQYVHDVEAYAIAFCSFSSKHVADILKWIENATYNGGLHYKDRFGSDILLNNMCTGSKALVLIDEFGYDIAVNTVEFGVTVFQFITLNNMPCRLVIDDIGKLQWCDSPDVDLFYKDKYYESVAKFLDEEGY